MSDHLPAMAGATMARRHGLPVSGCLVSALSLMDWMISKRSPVGSWVLGSRIS